MLWCVKGENKLPGCAIAGQKTWDRELKAAARRRLETWVLGK